MKICEKCQTPLADDAGFCTNCGAKVAAPAPASTIASPSPSSEPATSPTPSLNGPIASSSPIAAPVAKTQSSSNNTKVILIASAVVAAILIGVIGFFVGKSSKGSSNSGSTNSNTSINTSQNSSNSTANSASNTGSKVTLGNYTLTIPNEFDYEVTVANGYDAVSITDGSNTWSAIIAYEETATWQQLVDNFDTVAESYLDAGTQTINGTTFYWLDNTISGYPATHWISPAGDYIFETITADLSSRTNHTIIEKVAPILSSASARSTSRSTGPSLLDGLDSLSE